MKVDPRILRNISTGVYYRRGATWYARPVIGKNLPGIRHETMMRLIAQGLVYIPNPQKRRPHLTKKGNKVAFPNL